MSTPAADAPADTAPPADTDTPEPSTEPTPAEQPKSDTDDEAAKWKAMARKHESEAKKLAKQIAEVQAAQMSDQEKAISEAEQRGALSARQSLGQKLAAAELKAAGVPAEMLDDLNLARYVTDDGDVDDEQVSALAAKFASITVKAPVPQVPTGPQNGTSKPQMTRDELKRMSPEEIVKAKADGRLDDLLAGRTP